MMLDFFEEKSEKEKIFCNYDIESFEQVNLCHSPDFNPDDKIFSDNEKSFSNDNNFSKAEDNPFIKPLKDEILLPDRNTAEKTEPKNQEKNKTKEDIFNEKNKNEKINEEKEIQEIKIEIEQKIDVEGKINFEDKNDMKEKNKVKEKNYIQEKNEVKENNDVKEKKIIQEKIIISEVKENAEENKKPPTQYVCDKIKNIYNSKLIKDSTKEIFNKNFKKTNNLEELEKKMSDEVFFSLKKRNRDKEPEKFRENKKSGRKKKDEPKDGIHNKNSEDNIIKKIKAKFIYFLLSFINSIFNSFLGDNKIILYVKFMKNIKTDKEPEKEDLLKDLDYQKIVNETKKEKNLEFLKMTLKDFLSLEISPKFKTLPSYSNRNVINEIIKNENENEIIMFVLKGLTLRDYLDIFTYKKELSDFGKLEGEKYKQIMANFTRVDELLTEIDKLNDGNNYFSIFTSLLYNYERWFFIKKERNRNKKSYEE